MRKTSLLVVLTLFCAAAFAQEVMTPEKLIELRRVSPKGISEDGKYAVYAVRQYSLQTDATTKRLYKIPIKGGEAVEITSVDGLLKDDKISPDGKFRLFSEEVKIEKVKAQDYYNDVPKAEAYIYNDLMYRHWDTWEDGAFGHVFYQALTEGAKKIDLMPGEPFDCPMKPFGGAEDYIWHPDGTKILYVTKKMSGTAYAVSTNSDIYMYDLESKETKNLTKSNKGYDLQPAFSSQGRLAWLQMKRDGYESDKNDVLVDFEGKHLNLTAAWDGTVNSFHWNNTGDEIYFVAPTQGTVQLFKVKVPENAKNPVKNTVKQITDGQFDVHGIVGQASANEWVVRRRDMNHATELFVVDVSSGKMRQLTHENDAVYKSVTLGEVKKRMVKTTDGKDMLSWVIYPPNFDPAKKYPTLLYCQGGPQGALSQFYSFRWNFQQMAAHGYIIIAPNRRGMPGYGVAWNEQISKDYGGQNMKDYLSAIDDLAKEPYVDKNRLGCIGASYGGYSVFYLATMHENRFKTFISHDGLFNLRSMYGTTEELFFVNWDMGGPYWDKKNKAAQKTFADFNPANFVSKWNRPILIIQGGKDFRVPIGQALEAFQAAKLQGLKSRLLYFPRENHWIIGRQNSLVWQREFFKWLEETLK